MLELMFSLLTWISVQEEQPQTNIDWSLPTVTLVSQKELCHHYGLTESQCKAAGLVGFYDQSGGIMLRDDFNTDNPLHVSRLLHELVHHMQYENHVHTETCLGQLEVEAYDLQNKWLAFQDKPPAIGSFRRTLFLASCDS